jgi:energy-coupling factor transport system permease protein
MRGRRGRVGWIPRIKYLGRDSPLDRLNPVAKLVWVVSVTVSVFMVFAVETLMIVLVALLVLFAIAKVRLWELRAATRFFLVFSLMLMLIHAFFVHVGDVIWQAQPGPITITITGGGLYLGLRMVLRFLIIVMASFLFVATTEPNRLAHSLMDVGLPYRAGFALLLAMRLMPLMRSESNAVREAQAARGLALDQGGPMAMVRSIRSTLGPLLVSSMSRVDSLTISMEGRAFGQSKERTFIREVRWRMVDRLLVVAALLFLAIVLDQYVMNV